MGYGNWRGCISYGAGQHTTQPSPHMRRPAPPAGRTRRALSQSSAASRPRLCDRHAPAGGQRVAHGCRREDDATLLLSRKETKQKLETMNDRDCHGLKIRILTTYSFD